MQLTTNQQTFVNEASEALQRQGFYSLCGVAGSGKSTVLLPLYEMFPNIQFLTPTHKAKAVLKSKLGATANVTTTTSFTKSFKGTKLDQIDDRVAMAESRTVSISILQRQKDSTKNKSYKNALTHLIKLLEDPNCLEKFKKQRKVLITSGEAQQPVFTDYLLRDDDDYLMVVVDESSMVTKRDRDLIIEKADAVLFVGDGFQLPPVSREDGEDWFAHRKHDWHLNEVIRQKKGSGILKLATAIRDANGVFNIHKWVEKKRGDYNDIFLANYCDEMLERLDQDEWVCLGFRNDNVDNMCYDVREVLGRNPEVVVKKDRLFCANNFGDFSNKDEVKVLKKYKINQDDAIFGRMARPVGIFNETKDLEGQPIVNDARLISGISNKERRELLSNRGLLLRFDYARTVHASQGSEWQNVVYEHLGTEVLGDEVQNRLVYTAITRAKEKFILLK